MDEMGFCQRTFGEFGVDIFLVPSGFVIALGGSEQPGRG
ncbi:hypothetical protein SAMN05444168_4446 [Paraburkholderia phenazinium]|uniref:Uncharacterized protein n=1 Tax=Paraburkholderia phenazinium TaxID=60549 RepID=A0A1N6JIG2_9BURK|nr:hypothetical protein SAMN05444168_4446 [Paraburkholderia phenazinium]